MARRAGPPLRPPCEWYLRGSFPFGQLQADAPLAVVAAVEVGRRLVSAVKASTMTVSDIVDAADIGRSTYYDLVGGKVFPDFITLVKLGEVLGEPLWPAGESGAVATSGRYGSSFGDEEAWVRETRDKLEETRLYLEEMAERMRRGAP